VRRELVLENATSGSLKVLEFQYQNIVGTLIVAQRMYLQVYWIAAGSTILSAVVPHHAERRNSREPPLTEDRTRTGDAARGPRSFLWCTGWRLATASTC